MRGVRVLLSFAICLINGEKGRTRLQIPLEHLRFWLEKKFKVAEIANLFGASKRTVERRMKDFGLSAATTYTQLSSQQLDELIRDIQRDFPNAGCERVTGHCEHSETLRKILQLNVWLPATETQRVFDRNCQCLRVRPYCH